MIMQYNTINIWAKWSLYWPKWCNPKVEATALEATVFSQSFHWSNERDTIAGQKEKLNKPSKDIKQLKRQKSLREQSWSNTQSNTAGDYFKTNTSNIQYHSTLQDLILPRKLELECHEAIMFRQSSAHLSMDQHKRACLTRGSHVPLCVVSIIQLDLYLCKQL